MARNALRVLARTMARIHMRRTGKGNVFSLCVRKHPGGGATHLHPIIIPLVSDPLSWLRYSHAGEDVAPCCLGEAGVPPPLFRRGLGSSLPDKAGWDTKHPEQDKMGYPHTTWDRLCIDRFSSGGIPVCSFPERDFPGSFCTYNS